MTVTPGETIDIELKKVGTVKAGDKTIVDLPNIFSNVQFQPTVGFKAKVIGNQLIITVEPFEEAGITIFPFGGYLKSKVKISDEISNTSGKIIINNRPIKITIKNDEKKNQNSKGENQKPSTRNENPDIYKGAIGKNFLSYLYNDWTYSE